MLHFCLPVISPWLNLFLNLSTKFLEFHGISWFHFKSDPHFFFQLASENAFYIPRSADPRWAFYTYMFKRYSFSITDLLPTRIQRFCIKVINYLLRDILTYIFLANSHPVFARVFFVFFRSLLLHQKRRKWFWNEIRRELSDRKIERL